MAALKQKIWVPLRRKYYITAVARKWYIPVLGELVVNPILGGTKALIGVAQMVAGVALAIFGSCCYYIFDRHFGATVGWMGFNYLIDGFFAGVLEGLALATPIIGAILLGKVDGKK